MSIAVPYAPLAALCDNVLIICFLLLLSFNLYIIVDYYVRAGQKKHCAPDPVCMPVVLQAKPVPCIYAKDNLQDCYRK